MSDTAEKIQTTTVTEISDTVAEPKLYRVVYINDNVTPMEYVVMTLVEIFGRTTVDALEITVNVHEQGSGVAIDGVTKELADTLKMAVDKNNALQGFPLQVVVEVSE